MANTHMILVRVVDSGLRAVEGATVRGTILVDDRAVEVIHCQTDVSGFGLGERPWDGVTQHEVDITVSKAGKIIWRGRTSNDTPASGLYRSLLIPVLYDLPRRHAGL